MKVKLMTDAPKHNLALMRISTYHKKLGDEVFLGNPQDDCDLSYGSWLFNEKYATDISGGVGTDHKSVRLGEIGICKPDYSLYNLDYSLGYTWEYCPRKCEFCFVKDINPPKEHYSIYEFHNKQFNKIRLLNNNTFSDPQWRETFGEIWQANLTVLDEGGYDLRLLDYEKVWYLNATKYSGMIHFAFDRMDDEKYIRQGLKLLKGLRHPLQIYVLVGFPNYRPIDETDIARCQIIADSGFDPFVMVYNRVVKSKEPHMRMLNQFERMVNRTFIWRESGFAQAWKDYTKC